MPENGFGPNGVFGAYYSQAPATADDNPRVWDPRRGRATCGTRGDALSDRSDNLNRAMAPPTSRGGEAEG